MTVGSLPASLPQADVVFVVERTALNGAYLNELKTTYILPTLEHFNGGSIESSKDCASDSNYVLYGLVTFNSGDILPGNLTEAYGPLTTAKRVLDTLDKIQFCGGHGEAASHVAEGLATALSCLDDLSGVRGATGISNGEGSVAKHVVLVCNCKPVGMPVIENEGPDGVYNGLNAEQLAAYMAEKNINLSVMAPRKIPALISLFDKAGGNSSVQKGYARDPRYLVLLQGFALQERPVTPPAPVKQENPPAPIVVPVTAVPQTSQPATVTATVSVVPPLVSITAPPVTTTAAPTTVMTSVPSSMGQPMQPTASAPFRGPRPNMPVGAQPMRMGTPISVGSQGLAGGMANVASPGVSTSSPAVIKQEILAPVAGMPIVSTSTAATSQPMNMMSSLLGTQASPQMNTATSLSGMTATAPSVSTQQIVTGAVGQPGVVTGQSTQSNAVSGNMQTSGVGVGPRMAGMQQSMNPQQMANAGMANIKFEPGQQPMSTAMTMTTATSHLTPQQQAQLNQARMLGQTVQANPRMNALLNQNPAGGTMGPGGGQRWPGGPRLQQQQPIMMTAGATSGGMIQSVGQQQQQQSANQSSPLLQQLQQPPAIAGNQQPGPQLQVGVQGALMNQQGLSRERHVIWSGFLEWQEKLKGPPEGQKVPRQAPCQVTAQVVNGEPEVKGDGWPSKLIMQLIPKGIVGNLGGQYFKDVKTVIFMLQQCLESENLTKVMDTGFAGCVHFQGNMPNCSIKVLILLYAKDKNTFLGFIPNDQLGFVDRIRRVIQQQKNANMNQRGLPAGVQNQLQGVAGLAGPGMPQAQGNMQVGGNQMQHAQPGQPLAMQGAGLQAGNVGQIQGLQGQNQNMSGAVGMQQQPAMAAGAQQGNIQMIGGGMNQMPGMAGQQASGAGNQPSLAVKLGTQAMAQNRLQQQQLQQLQLQQQQQQQQLQQQQQQQQLQQQELRQQQQLQQQQLQQQQQQQNQMFQQQQQQQPQITQEVLEERQRNTLRIQELQQQLQAEQAKALQLQQMQSGGQGQGQINTPAQPGMMVNQQQLSQPRMAMQQMLRHGGPQGNNPGLKNLLQQQVPQGGHQFNPRMQMMNARMQGGQAQAMQQQQQQQQQQQNAPLDPNDAFNEFLK